MTREEAKGWIHGVVVSYNDLAAVFDSADKLCGLAVDSPFGEAVWRSFEILVKATSEVLCDTSDSLSWYLFDNECGRQALQHSDPSGKMRVVQTLDDLLDVLGY